MMKNLLLPFFTALIVSCSYNLPMVRFKTPQGSHFDPKADSTTDRKDYNYIRISRYGIIGHASKTIYSDDSMKTDSVITRRVSAVVFDGSVTIRQKKVIYDAFGNHKIVVKARTRTHGWKPATSKIVTKMYVPIRRMRTVERY